MLALARMTCSHSLRQPATILAGLIALALLALSFVFGIFNFDDNDRLRLLATSGVAINTICALFLGVILASTGLHDELADRTALTLLAKPVSRWSFLAEKALGIWIAVGCVMAVIAGAHYLAFWIASTWGFGTSPRGGLVIYADSAWIPWLRIGLAHLAAWWHAAILVSLTSVLALRLGLTANIIVSFAVFVLANLLGAFDIHGLILLPASGLFALDDALQYPDQHITLAYFALSLVYTVLYSLGLLLIGICLLERQDLT